MTEQNPPPPSVPPPPTPTGYPPASTGYAPASPPVGLYLWLILPMVMVLVFWCGVAGLPFNVTGLVFAFMAMAAHQRGDVTTAVKRVRRAKIFTIIGMVLGFLNIALGITAAITTSV